MLKLKNLNIYYEKMHAVKNVNLEVKDGEIVSLVGANGAGKSTILKAISGLLKAKSGEVLFYDESIKNYAPEKIMKMGLAHVPEGRKIFPKMTVKENLEIGGYTNSKSKQKIIEIYDMFPIFEERKSQLAGTLSGGEQQMLAIGRALMGDPKFLMLDEPSMGLAPKFVEQIFEIIKNLQKQNITILLIEQNVQAALSLSDRAYIIESGEIVLNDLSKNLINDDKVQRAYFGLVPS